MKDERKERKKREKGLIRLISVFFFSSSILLRLFTVFMVVGDIRLVGSLILRLLCIVRGLLWVWIDAMCHTLTDGLAMRFSISLCHAQALHANVKIFDARPTLACNRNIWSWREAYGNPKETLMETDAVRSASSICSEHAPKVACYVVTMSSDVEPQNTNNEQR